MNKTIFFYVIHFIILIIEIFYFSLSNLKYFDKGLLFFGFSMFYIAFYNVKDLKKVSDFIKNNYPILYKKSKTRSSYNSDLVAISYFLLKKEDVLKIKESEIRNIILRTNKFNRIAIVTNLLGIIYMVFCSLLRSP